MKLLLLVVLQLLLYMRIFPVRLRVYTRSAFGGRPYPSFGGLCDRGKRNFVLLSEAPPKGGR